MIFSHRYLDVSLIHGQHFEQISVVVYVTFMTIFFFSLPQTHIHTIWVFFIRKSQIHSKSGTSWARTCCHECKLSHLISSDDRRRSTDSLFSASLKATAHTDTPLSAERFATKRRKTIPVLSSVTGIMVMPHNYRDCSRGLLLSDGLVYANCLIL